jgi:transposase InsO family protein
LKSEMFYSRQWLSTTIEEFVTALDDYISWYNDVRIKRSLGFRSPAEHRGILGIAA